METVYPALRHIHMTSVALSGAFFLLRALAFNLSGAAWPKAMAVRRVSHVIDTVLLASAIALTVTIGQYPLLDGWLTMKLGLLVVYIGLGVFALRPALARPARLAFTAAAATVFLFIVSVARAHDPAGLFGGL